MDPTFWHQRWAENDTPFNQSQANPLLVANFDMLALPQGSRVFVPMCGKSLDIPWIRSKGHRVAGAELSKAAVEQFYAELGVQPEVSRRENADHYSAGDIEVFVGDIFELSRDAIGPVDAVYDRAALVALPEEMRRRYAAHVMGITNDAPQVLITFEYDQRLMEGPPFSVSKEEVNQLYRDTYEITLLTSVDVPGGLKGKCPALESIWLLKRSA